MADMTTIKGKIRDTIYPNGTGAITADKHQALLLEMVDDINTNKADVEALTALEQSLTLKADKSEVASQLTKLSEEIDNLPKGDEFDAEGNYPSLRVGTADTAIDLAGRGESVPAEFGFRASGGKSIKDGRAYIKSIKGNSVVWNNQSENSLSQDSPTQSLPIGSKLVQGHKYLMLAESMTNCTLFLYYNIDGSNVRKRFENTYSFFTSDASISANGLISGQGALWWYVLVQDSTVEYSANNVRLIDLTQMFGTEEAAKINTIEDYIARKPIVEDEYAYNEGEVIHCNTESIKSVGDNAWDEEWENGHIDVNTGQLSSNSDAIRNANIIRVLPNNQYHVISSSDLHVLFYDRDNNYLGWKNQANKNGFTTPQNAYYIRFYCPSTKTYNHDIMITLVHSGWKQDTDAGYQPYWQDTLPLPIIRNYFPDGMKKAGTAHDEIRYNKASGKKEYSKGRFKSVDLGTLNWRAIAASDGTYSMASDDLDSIANAVSANNIVGNILCAKFLTISSDDLYLHKAVESIAIGRTGRLTVFSTGYTTSDAADSFKAAMEGVILYYESNDWEWVELDAEDQNFRDYYQVADFGTEQSQSSVPSANFSADIIYQFNAVDMIREHELEITELQKVIATMQAQLTSLTNGGQ